MLQKLLQKLALRKAHGLHGKKNVIGHTIGTDGRLQILVTQKLPEERLASADVVPKKFWGVRTDVEEREMPKALASPKKVKGIKEKKKSVEVPTGKISTAYQIKVRPFQPGVSIGDVQSSYKHAGTLGIICKRKKYKLLDREVSYTIAKKFSDKLLKVFGFSVLEYPVAITNHHVARNLNGVVLQPGTLDGGVPMKDSIGVVEARGNYKDKNPIDISVIRLTDLNYKIEPLNLREIKSLSPNYSPTYGLLFKKSGRTSYISYGTFNKIVDITVDMAESGQILFKGVYEVDQAGTPLASLLLPGDSGSAVFDTNGKLIGIGFAGGSRYSYVIPIDRIVKEFGLTL